MIETITMARAFNVAGRIHGEIGYMACFVIGRAMALRVSIRDYMDENDGTAEYLQGIGMIRRAIRERKFNRSVWDAKRFWSNSPCETAGYSYAAGDRD